MPSLSEKSSSESLLPSTNATASPTTADPSRSSNFWKGFKWVALTLLIYQFTQTTLSHPSHHRHHHHSTSSAASKCVQAPEMTPSTNLTDVYEKETKLRIVEWLGGAVRIPTESFDVMGPPGEDERWEIFKDLHAYLEEAYPLVHKTLKVTKVDIIGLVFEWQGSNDTLKPLLLTGHLDVVPVEPQTVDKWTHPPFSGLYDGEFIWGRGSGDDKSGVIGILSAVELLLESGYIPTRPVILAFGFDEETGGKVGARAINEFLEGKYGRDSMYMLVDEGNGMSEQFGQVFAGPAVAEKGYLDVQLTVSTPGGHSSVPPPHTGIGLLALAITQLEAHPVPARLTRANPLFTAFQCFAEADEFPKKLGKTVHKAAKSDKALKELEEYMVEKGGAVGASIGTTRAVDIISGGVKVNALPELVHAVINHRISFDSSVSSLQSQLTSIITPLASSLHLNFVSFGENISSSSSSSAGTITLSEAYSSALEPAPVSPHSVDSGAWRLLSGSAKSTWASSSRKGAGGELVFVPGLAIGNTDTKRYWGLTRNIYRFGYALESDGFGIHTVDEHIKADSIVEGVRFFQTLILNSGEVGEEELSREEGELIIGKE